MLRININRLELLKKVTDTCSFFLRQFLQIKQFFVKLVPFHLGTSHSVKTKSHGMERLDYPIM